VTEETFTAFVEEEYARLVRAVALVSGSTTAAEDAVQEALARAWERSRRGEVIESLGRWTVTVALNLARSGARHGRVQEAAWPELVARSIPRPVDRDRLLDLRHALDGLPRRQREATVLHYYFGLPVREVADVLHVGEGTVKTALHRARASLARQLVEPDPGSTDPGEVVDVHDPR
jgi:RNA polymerase sigma-70 factor (ECF subfamily)